jgi:hypothetical protein
MAIGLEQQHTEHNWDYSKVLDTKSYEVPQSQMSNDSQVPQLHLSWVQM